VPLCFLLLSVAVSFTAIFMDQQDSQFWGCRASKRQQMSKSTLMRSMAISKITNKWSIEDNERVYSSKLALQVLSLYAF